MLQMTSFIIHEVSFVRHWKTIISFAATQRGPPTYTKQSPRWRERQRPQLLGIRSSQHPNSPTSPWVDLLLALLALLDLVRLVLHLLGAQRGCSRPSVDVLQQACLK